MRNTRNLSGLKFGKWLVLNKAKNKNGYYFECVCDCGTKKHVLKQHLVHGESKSCGCSSREHPHHLIHGDSIHNKTSQEYNTWRHMKGRCFNKKNKYYNYYGGRGITVCLEWVEDYSKFLKDMGRKPSPSHSLDRIDNHGNYEPSNCRWATQIEQTNNARKNVFITYNGATKTIAQWARALNMSYGLLYNRIHKQKWSFDDAIHHPKIKNQYGKIKDTYEATNPNQRQNTR